MIQWLKSVVYWFRLQWHKQSSEIKDISIRDITDKELEVYCKHNASIIDLVTWHDLELNDVYRTINRTLTSTGEEQLVKSLMTPAQDLCNYKIRKDKLSYFHKNESCYTSVRKGLNQIGHIANYSTTMFRQYLNKEDNKIISIGVMLLYLLIIPLLFMTSNVKYPLIICVYCLGAIITHYSYNLKHKYKLMSYSYLIHCAVFYLNTKDTLKDIYKEQPKYDEMSHLLMKCKRALLRTEGIDSFADFREIIWFNLVRKAKKVDQIVIDYMEVIEQLLIQIGEIDLMQSVYSYQQENPSVIEPSFVQENLTFECHNLKNILVKDAIGNDVFLHKGMVITGSNMSGKSTLLRAIGTNVILAQGLGFVCADKYRSSFVQLITSISLKDQIKSGKSYFMMEAEAIKRMLDVSHGNCIFLIDEIFKGTNPMERLAASVEVLNILNQNSLVVVTTHDIEIINDLKDYERYYFEHTVEDGRLIYDYHLKSGVASQKNAVKLMASIGYPDGLIKKVYERMGV